MLTKSDVRKWLEESYVLLVEHRQQLTDLDSAIGDGDHGTNMVRGFKAVCDALEELEQETLPQMLKGVGMVLLSHVGGVSGPLYGTFFLKGSACVEDNDAIDKHGLLEFLTIGYEGVCARGRADVKDKTLIDVWHPAIAAYARAILQDKNMKEALECSVDAAQHGLEETIPMIARKGRASYLGEHSRGHQDPGATSSYYIIMALYKSVGGE